MNFKKSKDTPKETKPKSKSESKSKSKSKPKQSKEGKIAMYKDSELIRTFDSLKQAKQYFGLANNNNAIYKVLTGRSKAYKGYTFSYID